MTDQDQGVGRKIARMFGALLMAAGAMIAGLCGLCSAVVLVTQVASAPPSLGSMLVLVLIFGGVPITLGVGLFIWGRSLWRTGSQ